MDTVKVYNKLQFLPLAKEYYKIVTPTIMKERKRGLGVCPYGLNFTPYQTPIEAILWGYIRCAGLPFYPEYPILDYFIDFADPYLKIGIEADGKEWHNKNKDEYRDTLLKKEGWTIYRISGDKVMRSIPEKIEEEIDERFRHEGGENYYVFRRKYLNEMLGYCIKYSAGILEVIAERHYNRQIRVL